MRRVYVLCWMYLWMGLALAGPRDREVTITSEPEGATVFIGDKESGARGETPLTLSLPPGEHTVILELPRQAPLFENISVPKGAGTLPPFHFAFPSSEGTLIIGLDPNDPDSDEPAQVIVDETAQGETPVRVSVKPGTHRVVVKRGGKRLFDDELVVEELAEVKVLVEPSHPRVQDSPLDEPGPRDANAPDGGGNEDDQATEASPSHWRDWLQLQLGLSVLKRSVAYTVAASPKLYTFDQGGQLMLGLALEAWPLRKVGRALGRVRVMAGYQYGLGQQFTSPEAYAITSAYRTIHAGLGYDHTVGPVQLGGVAAYELLDQRFAGSDEARLVVPGLNASWLRLGAVVGWQRARLWVRGSFAYRLALASNGFPQRFTNPSGAGLDLGVEGRFRLGQRYFVAVALSLVRASWTFTPNGTAYLAKGASDQTLGLLVGGGVAF